MDPIEKYRESKEEAERVAKKIGRAEFKPFFTTLFMRYPTVHAVQWTQFTPHFNDGSPCTFDVQDPYVARKPIAEMTHEEARDTETDAWAATDAWVTIGKRSEDPGDKAAHEVRVFFNGLEDVLQTTFGDGVQVRIERNGNITVEEYDHD